MKRAVESALRQTHRDLEVIVVDDGSDDGTAEALGVIDDARLRYVWQPHRGAAAARNTGIRLARGSSAAFLDSDDRWLPDHVGVLVEVLESHPDAVLATTCPRFEIGGRDRPSNARSLDALPQTIGGCFGGYPSCAMVRRTALLATGGFDERFRVMEDCDLWLRLSALGSFCVLQRRTVIHQDTLGSLVARGIRDGSYLESEELCSQSALALAQSVGRQDRSELVRRARGRVAFVRALRALRERDDETVGAALEEACRLSPELLSAQDYVSRRIVKMSADPEGRLRIVAAAARLWPDPRSDTGIFLRWRAAGLALQRVRPLKAISLAAGSPFADLPSFLVRNRARWYRIARRRAQTVRYRGREADELAGALEAKE